MKRSLSRHEWYWLKGNYSSWARSARILFLRILTRVIFSLSKRFFKAAGSHAEKGCQKSNSNLQNLTNFWALTVENSPLVSVLWFKLWNAATVDRRNSFKPAPCLRDCAQSEALRSIFKMYRGARSGYYSNSE